MVLSFEEQPCYTHAIPALKNVIDWVLTINLIFLTSLMLYWWLSGTVHITVDKDTHGTLGGVLVIDSQTQQLFASTLREAVDRERGQPTEGYTPRMFIAVFPGLVVTDFEGVESSIGKYVVVEGELVHVTPPGRPLHSAAAAVSNQGLATLLTNVAKRTQIDLTQDGTITDIMRVISEEAL